MTDTSTSHPFFTSLCADCHALHAGSLAHPAVRGIGRGDLPRADFRAYLEQDYCFLLCYARVLAHAVAAAPDRATATRLAELLRATLAVEVDALAALYTRVGGDPARLDTVEPAPACRAYTEHLETVAAGGSLLVILAGILPCQWGYREIGRALQAAGPPVNGPYADWIAEYAGNDYGALVDWLLDRFETLAAGGSEHERQVARDAFRASSAHELAFWDVALPRPCARGA